MKHKIWVAAMALVAVWAFAGVGYAGVIFEDNFDSHANWQPSPGTGDEGTSGASSACSTGDCTGKVPAGWSYYRTTGWWWGPTYEDTIRVNSDNYRGGTGKSFTIWHESNNGTSGDGWGADGILMKHLGAEYQEIYFRVWAKAQPGWNYSNPSDTLIKMFRIMHLDAGGDAFRYFTNGDAGPIVIWDLKQSLRWGVRHAPAFRADPQETAYYALDSINPDKLWGSSSSDRITDPGYPCDGGWHRYDVHLKMNTYSNGVWQSNGVYEFWYDGKLIQSRSDIPWKQNGSSTSIGWNAVGIGGNAYNTYADPSAKAEQSIAFDDLVVSTTPIAADYVPGGSKSTAPAEEPVVEKPAPPSALRIM